MASERPLTGNTNLGEAHETQLRLGDTAAHVAPWSGRFIWWLCTSWSATCSYFFCVKAKDTQALIVTMSQVSLHGIDLGSPPKAKGKGCSNGIHNWRVIFFVCGSTTYSNIPTQAGVDSMAESLLKIELGELMDAAPSFTESQEGIDTDWGAPGVYWFAERAIIDNSIPLDKGKASHQATFACTWDKDKALRQACIPDHVANPSEDLWVG